MVSKALLKEAEEAVCNSLPLSSPEQEGLSAERLARITSEFQAYVDNGQLPGLLTAVVRHGKIVHFATQGYADIAAGKPLRADTIFRLYSMIKPLTSAAVLMLAEQERLQLDDPISKYLPEFAHLKVYAGEALVDAQRPVTIHHLLTMTAGMTADTLQVGTPREEVYKPVVNEVMRRLGDVNLEQHVRQVAQLPLIVQPGTQWNYGESMGVAARIVEVISGRRFSEFLHDYIFVPLQMNDTGYHVPAEKAERLACLYTQGTNGGIELTDSYGGDYTRPATLEGGGAGLVGTAGDYLRFCQMLLGRGSLDGVRILASDSVALMLSNHLTPELGPTPLATLSTPTATLGGLGFGYGGLIVTDPDVSGIPGSKGQYSWGGWAGTDFWIDPEQDLIGMVFTQLIPAPVPEYSQFLPTRARMHEMTYQAIVS